jgi:mannose-6-phosphate isomerase-like protein (cupin superfamily)
VAEQEPERLARYWDALAAQQPANANPDPAETDPTLAETIRRFHAAGDVAGPDPAFVAGLQAKLLGPPIHPATGTGRRRRAGQSPSLTTVPNGRAGSGVSHWPVLRPGPGNVRWLAMRSVVAALLVLTLVAGLSVLRIVRPGMIGPGEALVETLLDTTIEVEGAPGAWVPFGVERWTFPSGPAALRVPPIAGPQWVVVDGGNLVAAVDGTEQTLEPGDSLVVEAGRELVVRNAGAGEAAIYRSVATTGFVFEDFDPRVISRRPVLDTLATLALPTGATRVVFKRLTMSPGGALPPQATGEFEWFGVVEGRLGLTLAGDKLPAGWWAGAEQEVGAFEQWPRLVPGTELTLRNLGEEPLVLLHLTVVPETAGEPTAPTAEAVTTAG